MSWSIRPVGPTPSLQDLARELLGVAAVLIGVGSALGLAGLAMGAAALATAGRRGYSRADLTPVSSPGSSGSRPRRLREPAAEPGGRPNWPSTHHVADARRDTADVAPGGVDP
jgi:hypothetical protein